MTTAKKKSIYTVQNTYPDRVETEEAVMSELTVKIGTIETAMLLLSSMEESVLITVFKHLLEYSRPRTENIAVLREKGLLDLLQEKNLLITNESVIIKRFALYLTTVMIENMNTLEDLEVEKVMDLLDKCVEFYNVENDTFCIEYLSAIINKCLDDPRMARNMLQQEEYLKKLAEQTQHKYSNSKSREYTKFVQKSNYKTDLVMPRPTTKHQLQRRKGVENTTMIPTAATSIPNPYNVKQRKKTRFLLPPNRRSWSESDLLKEIDKELKLAKGFLFADEAAPAAIMITPKFKAKAPTGTAHPHQNERLVCIHRDSFCRVSERSSKRKLRTEMISKPQNDLKHTGHVGIDGASFGDVAFLGNSQNYNHVPRQIVTPYKPSEDIEQTPLLLPPTPTSPDSLQTASGYFPEGANVTSSNPTFISSAENTPKNFSNTSQSSFEFPGQQLVLGPTVNVSTNPFASKNDDEVNMSAAYAMQNNQYSNDSKMFANEIEVLTSSQAGISGRPSSRSNSEDPHVYHEISDDEMVADKLDFGPSLLAEINSMFGSMSATSSQPKSPDFEHVNIKNEFTEISTKLVRKNSAGDANGNKFGIGSMKKKTAGTVKQISVKDEKILNQAIEIANEMSARSMIDLGADPAISAQSPKRKFSFRFPHLSNNGSNDKSNSNGSPNHAGGGVNNGLHTGISSPYSKKKNFTEELKSIPDLQRFRSLNEIKNYNNADIRIPLFDKKSSDFCFEKSREILTRPLSFDPPPGLSNTTNEKKRDRKSISENIMDIENTLKALNQDFMYTYTELNKTDSDETILNEQFSSIVSSIDEEISSATGSLRSAVYNYSNGVQTMFDFNAATNHIDKHLQYMNAQSQNQSVCDTTLDQKLIEDKRSSTPDTGFASRDTNISLSRRSSQKSSYSPQENFFNPKDLHIASSGYTGLREENTLSSERFCTKYNALSASPNKTAEHVSNNSVYSPRELKIDTEQFKNKSYRQRSMSFTDHFNPISPVMSEPQQRVKRQSTNIKNSQSNSNGQPTRRSASYKPRSIRARTLRRLSYNPIILDSSSSSDGESDCNRSVARSECDIRTRVSVLYRRRRQGIGHKTLSSCNDDHEAIVASNKLYGSNASIKSAPHYNYGGRMGSYRNYPRNMFDQLAYEDKIYDFGGRGPGNNYGVTATTNQNIIKPPKTFTVNGSCAGSGSGSSSTTSTAAPFSASTRSAIFHEFDVSRLTGKSPTSNFVNSSPEERNSRQSKGPNATPPTTLPLPLLNHTTNANTANTSKLQTEFHWPEKIHGSTVKQNDMFWRQQQRDVDAQSAFLRNLQTVDHIHTSDSSSTESGDEFVYRSEFIPHVPPSPAP
ncbi:uncharacterized protein LOC119674949 [Teleopsis dalmanni]|uniref:uncharacterized protein LOC119674949 n=1 Tax=Teleopsis dalmanni TaxID=139649 RepID=UPI0018CCEF78|nr:uncharacterized protein LOC119674949 [Teleopsis dalmanni]